MKNLYIAEKPSVAREFAKALGMKGAATAGARDGYLENEDTIVTWCVGHLITMSYPEVYDPALKKWSFDTIPFIPEEYKYEIIDASSKQFQIVSKLLNREDVDASMSALTRDEKENISTVLSSRWQAWTKVKKTGDECGLIRRPRKKSCEVSGRRKSFLPMIT